MAAAARTRTHTRPMNRKGDTKCIFDVQIVFIKSILVSSHYIIANKAARAGSVYIGQGQCDCAIPNLGTVKQFMCV